MNHCDRRFLRVGTICTLAATLWLGIPSQAALAFPEPEPMTGIGIEYVEPKIEAHKPIFERLHKRKVLEEYREFMAPLKLEHRLTVKLQDCGKVNAWYGNKMITYCYDLLAYFERIVAQYDVLRGFQKEDALVAAFAGVLLHETGHAIFDMLKIPLFGREEDAADAIASYVMLEVGKGSARRLLAGTAHVWRAWELEKQKRGTRRFEDYSDEHGTDAQRFYNALCIAHGSDQAAGTHVFKDLSELLPQDADGSGRRGRCAKEYLQAKYAFNRLIMPFVKEEELKKVRAKEWILTSDGKDILPPGKR